MSRLYIGICLSYEVAHNLKENIKRLAEIVHVFDKQEFPHNTAAHPKKKIPQTYYTLSDLKLPSWPLAVYNSFEYNGMVVNLYKSVVPGKIAKSDDEIYFLILYYDLLSAVSYHFTLLNRMIPFVSILSAVFENLEMSPAEG
mgnify:CR=1 FL=1